MNKTHILLIDDDEKISSLLVSLLEKRKDYIISFANDAKQAQKFIDLFNIDIAVLDVMMPEISGLDFLKNIRKQGRVFPVLMLSAMGEVEDKIKGLEFGADDYLAKPFDPQELILRIDAIIKRSEKKVSENKNIFSFGDDFVFDFSNMTLFKNSEDQSLSSVEVNLLSLLLENSEKILDRESIAEHLNLQNNPRAVDVQITRLRKKIEGKNSKKKFIRTIRNKGYQFLPF